MEIRQLKYFVAIAEHGAFSKAAEKLFVAQSALSHQLAQLEDELGARLFHRSRRGVELTEPGRVFLAHALAILRQLDDARRSVHTEAVRRPARSFLASLTACPTPSLCLCCKRFVSAFRKLISS